VCEVKENVLARRQLRSCRTLGSLARLIALFVGAFRPALSKQIGAFAGHGWACGWVDAAAVGDEGVRWEMVKNTPGCEGRCTVLGSAVAGSLCEDASMPDPLNGQITCVVGGYKFSLCKRAVPSPASMCSSGSSSMA
jgi:hypothetical protein